MYFIRLDDAEDIRDQRYSQYRAIFRLELRLLPGSAHAALDHRPGIQPMDRFLTSGAETSMPSGIVTCIS